MGLFCNVKKMAVDVRAWVFIFGIVGISMAKIFGFIELPKKVEEIREEVVENEDNIDQLAKTVDKYIAVQTERVKGEEKREAMMFELITGNHRKINND